MHQASEKDFKKEQGGGKCTGACVVFLVIQARSRWYQNRNSCLPDVPQVVVVVVSFLLQLQLLLRLLYIAKYNNECLCSAHEDAKMKEVCYLKSWVQFSFTVLRELRVSGVNSEVHRAGGRVLGYKYQTRSKSYQTLPKASKYYLEIMLKI
jgi:hypothetical protein